MWASAFLFFSAAYSNFASHWFNFPSIFFNICYVFYDLSIAYLIWWFRSSISRFYSLISRFELCSFSICSALSYEIIVFISFTSCSIFSRKLVSLSSFAAAYSKEWRSYLISAYLFDNINLFSFKASSLPVRNYLYLFADSSAVFALFSAFFTSTYCRVSFNCNWKILSLYSFKSPSAFAFSASSCSLFFNTYFKA